MMINVYDVPIAAFVNVTPVDPVPLETLHVNVPGVPTTVYLHPAVVESVHLTKRFVPLAVTVNAVGGTTNCPNAVGIILVIPVHLPHQRIEYDPAYPANAVKMGGERAVPENPTVTGLASFPPSGSYKLFHIPGLFTVYVAVALFVDADCEHVADSVTSKGGNVQKSLTETDGRLLIPLNVAVIVKGEYPV